MLKIKYYIISGTICKIFVRTDAGETFRKWDEGREALSDSVIK